MRETPNTTALLIEYGFIDNPNDVARLQANLLDYVEAVVRAVANYTGTPYAPPGGTVQNTYTVQRGDSLYSIAQKFGTTVSEIRALNNLTSNTLQIGQVLRLPSSTPTPTPPTGDTTTYTVQAGDSLYRIAQRFGVSVGDIIDANNLTSTVLSIGQQLIIPSTIPDEDVLTYTVQSGDSLYRISQRFGVSVDDIVRTNNLTSNVLQIGQVLKIPVTSTDVPDDEANYITYTVRSGDSLWKIANQYNTTVDAIRNLNNLTSNTLQIGQVLRVPRNDGTSSTFSYTVRSGDNLWDIARRYNTTVSELRSLNNLTSDVLSIGQVLQIPIT